MKHLKKMTALLMALCMVFLCVSCAKTKDDALHARFSVLYETDMLEEFLANPEQYAGQIEGFMLDDFAQTFADPDQFRSYTVEITVQNENDFAIEIVNLQMDSAKQGKNGVYFSLYSAGGQVGLPAQFTGGEAMYYQAIADSSLSMQDVLKTLGKMDIECLYADASLDLSDPDNLDPSKLRISSVLYDPDGADDVKNPEETPAEETAAAADAAVSADGVTADTAAAAANDVSAASAAAETTAAVGTTAAPKPGETTTAPARSGETAKAAAPASDTTKAAPVITAASTKAASKPGETTKPTSKPAAGSQTTTQSAGSASSGTPAAVTAKPGAVTADPTTTPALKGNAVAASRSYLNDTVPSTYVSSLKEKDLEKFGLTGDKQKAVLEHPEQWTAYTIQVDFENKESAPVTLYFLDVTDNGKGDVYVNGELSAELGLSPGGKQSDRFYVLAKASDTDGAVLKKVNDLSMRLQYAATPEDDEATPAFVYSVVR